MSQGLLGEPQVSRNDVIFGIVNKIAAEHSLHIDDILGASRIREVARARKAAYVALHKYGMSASEIARWLHRDPSTVSKYIRDYQADEA